MVPYKIHTVLTDNGIQFCDLPKNRSGPTAQWRTHMFDLLCQAHGIEHRLTKPNHPWTNGQVERMNRTLKDATVKRYHYGSHHQLRQHLATFLDAYNFAKRLKTLKGLTPFEAICRSWTKEPDRFMRDPIQLTPGLQRTDRGTLAGIKFTDPGAAKCLRPYLDTATRDDVTATVKFGRRRPN